MPFWDTEFWTPGTAEASKSEKIMPPQNGETKRRRIKSDAVSIIPLPDINK